MCRNIRVLHHFKPPTTEDEIRAAALQYVRKVAGISKMPTERRPGGSAARNGRSAQMDEAAIVERAVAAVAKATTDLLAKLPERGEPRTRENEKLRAKARWQSRENRIRSGSKQVANG